MVLVMTVQPGFGGQKYIPECTEKVQELKEIIDREELNVDIQVDGGINDSTMETAMRAGANFLVAGLTCLMVILNQMYRESSRRCRISAKS